MNEATSAVFFHLLRIGLQQETVSRDVFENISGEVDWHEIVRHGIKQGVDAIQYDGLQQVLEAKALPERLVPPRKLVIQRYLHSVQLEAEWQQQETAIASLAHFYASHDIRMMLLKGLGLSLLYPHPKHRPCMDIDIYLYGDQERADQLLAKEKGIAVKYGHHHHTIFKIDGIMVENHYDFMNTEAHLSTRDVEPELKRLAMEQPSEEVEIKGERVFLPPPTLNALFLLRHSGEHFVGSGITLRHLIDWAVFVGRYGKEVDWAWLVDFSKKLNMHRFLACMNGLCVEHLGLKSDDMPVLDYDKADAERMLNDMLYSPFAGIHVQELGPARRQVVRLRRWWYNRWKHRMVFREGLLVTFLVEARSHWVTPKKK